MVLFNTQKYQRLAELEARVQKAIEEAGAGGLDWAEEELVEAAGMAGFDLHVARLLDGPSLEAVLRAGEDGSEGRVWVAAEALFIDGVLARAEGREEEALDRLAKARRLYARLDPELRLPGVGSSPRERGRLLEEMLG